VGLSVKLLNGDFCMKFGDLYVLLSRRFEFRKACKKRMIAESQAVAKNEDSGLFVCFMIGCR
jgi:hypothetical protein